VSLEQTSSDYFFYTSLRGEGDGDIDADADDWGFGSDIMGLVSKTVGS
jgi:hypothetical protein